MDFATEYRVRQEMVDVCAKIYQKGFVAANDGNVSVRLEDGRVLITPTGVSKGRISPEELVVVDLEGRVLAADGHAPSSELPMHLYVYRERLDVRAVVHAHPLFSTAFAVAGIPLDKNVLAEAVLALGPVPVVEYATPGTEELAQALGRYLHQADAFLLANHGVVTVGQNLLETFWKLERLEHFAQISFIARLLGGERLLSREEVEKLNRLRERLGVRRAVDTSPTA
ncbi:MAG: class II aldolase/adducin family protein [candidate division KSB1 bacterium]|nr:class II aldolase/adducin family protein [candidate division KSB1 bacterium]